MVSKRALRDGGRAVVFVLLYSLLANALRPELGIYLRVAVALGAALAVFLALDVGVQLLDGGPVSLGEGSRLYAVRGLALLVVFFLVTAVAADGLRSVTPLSDTLVVLGGALVAVVVVFGPVVGYYYRRSIDATPA